MSMPNLSADELYKQSHTRLYYQPDGDGTRTYFGGDETQYMIVGGVDAPIQGGIDPVYIHDPARAGNWKLISRTISAPDLPSATLTFHEKQGAISRALMAPRCPFNLYEVHGRCKDLSDWARGWDGYVLIYAAGIASGRSLGDRTSLDSDDPLTAELDVTFAAIYPAGSINYENEAGTDVVVEVIDVVYGTAQSCGDCGTANDGTKHIYAITRANVGSPSAPGQLVYTLDGGLTWNTDEITGIGTTAEPRYIGIAGSVLFVGTDLTTLHYTVLDQTTGAPTTWSSVTLPAACRDVWVRTPREIYFAGASGTVYRTNDITQAPTSITTAGGANDLYRIAGMDEHIVAVGASNTVIRSVNGGASWATVTGPAAGVVLQALAVTGPLRYTIGTAGGEMWGTVDGGTSFVEQTFAGTGTGEVRDIVYATPQVGYALHDVSSVAYLLSTMDGGYTWQRNDQTSRTLNWPTFQKAGRMAVPTEADPAIAANYTAIAGLSTSGTDGVLLVGIPTII